MRQLAAHKSPHALSLQCLVSQSLITQQVICAAVGNHSDEPFYAAPRGAIAGFRIIAGRSTPIELRRAGGDRASWMTLNVDSRMPGCRCRSESKSPTWRQVESVPQKTRERWVEASVRGSYLQKQESADRRSRMCARWLTPQVQRASNTGPSVCPCGVNSYRTPAWGFRDDNFLTRPSASS
jgi:hypothetical protein